MESHVRIDDGMKRGPRKPRNTVDPVTKRFVALLPADQHLKAVTTAAQRIANGERLEDIANDLGVTKQAVSLWLLNEVPEQYKHAQRIGLIRKIVDADERLESANDPLDLARAREAARFARWDAERRLPSLFAQRQMIDVKVEVSVEQRLSEDLGKLIDGVVVEEQQTEKQGDT